MYVNSSNWNSINFVGKNATTNSGEMSRLKSRMGIKISGAPSSSAHILISKITKELTKAAATANERARVTYDRLTSKLERLSMTELEYTLYVLSELGFDGMVEHLRTKASLIKKNAMKWSRNLNKPENESISNEAIEDVADYDPIDTALAL